MGQNLPPLVLKARQQKQFAGYGYIHVPNSVTVSFYGAMLQFLPARYTCTCIMRICVLLTTSQQLQQT